MATSQQFLVCDSSTLANFKSWAQAVSGFFATAGWSQSADTGQVNWSTISTVPAANAYVYEVWQPNDGLTTFYVKVEYGSIATNTPTLRFTISAGTNGAGTATGLSMGPYRTAASAYTVPSTSIQYECNFSGAPGRIAVMMWRNGINGCQQFFAIERSINAAGSYTGAYVTYFSCGNNVNNWGFAQKSLVFGIGVPPGVVGSGDPGGLNGSYGFNVRGGIYAVGGTGAFNGTIPMELATPFVGYFDNTCTQVGVGIAADYAEGITFTTTVYGATRTYMPSKQGTFAACGTNNTSYILCMRYD